MRITLERLLDYLEQYDPDTVVFLTDDEARASDYDEDDFVVLEDALADIEDQLAD